MPTATKPPRRTASRKAKAETTKAKDAKSSNSNSKAKYASASSSASSRTVVPQQEHEDYSASVYAYADELLRKHVAFVKASKDLPSEDEDEDAMQVDRKGKGKSKETAAETLTLRERVVEAYNAAGGQPADGRWLFLVQLLRLQCTTGRYRWIAPQKNKISESEPEFPASIDLKQWSNEIADVLRRQWKPASGPEHEERLRVLAKTWRPDDACPTRSSVVVRGILEKREWAKEVGEVVRQWLKDSTLDGLTEIREIVEKTKLVERLEGFLQSLVPTDTYEPNKVKEMEKEQWVQHIKDFVRRRGEDSVSSRVPSSEATVVSPKQRKAEQLKEKVKTWQMAIHTEGASTEKQKETVSSSKSKPKRKEGAGRDPTDPTPLGFTVSKSSAARLGTKDKAKAVSSRKSDEDDIPSSDVAVPLPGSSRAKGISGVPESFFLPPSFSSSQLHHSTPNTKPEPRKQRKPSPIPVVPLPSSIPSDPFLEPPFTSSPDMRMRATNTAIPTTTAAATIPTNIRDNKRPRSPSPSNLDHRRPTKQPRTSATYHQQREDDNDEPEPAMVVEGHSLRMDVDQNSSQNQMPPPPPTSSPLTPLPASYSRPIFHTPQKAQGKGKAKALPTLTELLSTRKAEAEAVRTPGGKVNKYSLAAVSPPKAKAKPKPESKDMAEHRDRDGVAKEGKDAGANDADEVVTAIPAAAPAVITTNNATHNATAPTRNSTATTSTFTALAKPKPKPKSKTDLKSTLATGTSASSQLKSTVARAGDGDGDIDSAEVEALVVDNSSSRPSPAPPRLRAGDGIDNASDQGRANLTGGVDGLGGTSGTAAIRGATALETQTTVATTVPQHQPEYTASGYAVDLNLSGLSAEASREEWGWGRGQGARTNKGEKEDVDGQVKRKEKTIGKTIGKVERVKPKKKKRYFGMDDVDLSSPDKMKAKPLSSLAESDSDSDSSSGFGGEDEPDKLYEGMHEKKREKEHGKGGMQDKGLDNAISMLPDFTHDEDAFAPPLVSTQHQDRARDSEGTPRSDSRRMEDADVNDKHGKANINDLNMPPDFTHEDAFAPPFVSTQSRDHARGSNDTPLSRHASALGFEHSQSDFYASPPPIFGQDGKINVQSLDEPMSLSMSSPIFPIDSPPKPRGKGKGRELARAGSEVGGGSGAFGFGFCSQMDVEESVERVSRVLEKDVSLIDDDLDEDIDMDYEDEDRGRAKMWGGWY